MPELLGRQDLARLHRTLNDYPEALGTLTDTDERVLWCSEAGSVALLGRHPSDCVGGAIWPYIHPDDHARVACGLRNAGRGASVRCYYRVQTRQGDWRPMVSVSWPTSGEVDAVVTLSVPAS